MTEPTVAQSLVIGLDFGTTFSGAAWAIDGQSQNIEALASAQQAIRGVKLLLDEDQMYRYNPALRAKKLLSSLNKSPVDVSTETYGVPLDLTSTIYPRNMCSLSQPFAKDATMKIAINAGINEDLLSLLSEPEAAALYTLRAIQPNTIKDLISYCVDDLTPLKLREVVEGTGGVCGSMVLDNRFESLLEELLGFETFELLPENTRKAALQFWQESIKPNYDGTDLDDDDDPNWELTLPGLPDQPLIGLKGGFLQLTRSQVQGIFDLVVQDVIKLVQHQQYSLLVASADPSTFTIVFAKHFLKSPLCNLQMLGKRLSSQDWSNKRAAERFLGGLEGNRVRSRLARYHYGIVTQVKYERGHHSKSQRIWCKLEECWKVDGIMEWFIEKVKFLGNSLGTSLSESKPIRKSFYTTRRCDKDLTMKKKLYSSGSTVAPTRMGNDVSKLCEFRADLNAVPKQLFERHTNSKGISYYKIRYDLVIIPTSGYMYYQQELNGVSYGRVRAEY
uniref:Heat shock 70 kDa protein 12B n=1 Tax=Talaromyces marneffei PM1 TaxID=1077442 RepID=A0A093VI11_TALMA